MEKSKRKHPLPGGADLGNYKTKTTGVGQHEKKDHSIQSEAERVCKKT